jgi:peptidyl-prolyl cis-trans isomerase A (cyclophilin A)
MNKMYYIMGVFVLLMCGLNNNVVAQQKGDYMNTPGLYAKFDTSIGEFVCKLFPDEAPKTVANFVGLAEGTKEFSDMASGNKTKKPFYDGLIFHRVIPQFMIQGGDPTGTGRGGPGYKFEDEFHKNLKFDKSGRLAMANSGPNTNGSQFFITTAPTTWLDGNHSIFGQVVQGQDIVDKISTVEKDGMDRPLKEVVIKKLTIINIPSKKQ